jgi:hypothetical protein
VDRSLLDDKGFGSVNSLLDLLRELGGLGLLPAAPMTNPNGLYWDARHPTQGGTQRVGSFPAAPSPDYYRLVDSLEEAESIFGRGERPLLISNLHDVDPDAIDPNALRKFQEDQWAAPNGVPLFTDQGINPEHRLHWAAQQSGDLKAPEN